MRRKDVSLALDIAGGFGNINGAISSNIYRDRDAPRFRVGHNIVLCYIACGMIACGMYFLLLRTEAERESKGSDAPEREDREDEI